MSLPASASTARPAWVGAWTRFWFPTTTAVPLAVCRLVLVPAWLLVFAPPWDGLVVPLTYEPARINQTMILAVLRFVPIETFHTEGFLWGVYLVTTAGGVLATVGLFTRTSLLTFGLGHCLLVWHFYSYGELHHPEALFCVALVLLGLSPSGRCYSIDAWLGRRSKHPDRWGPDAQMVRRPQFSWTRIKGESDVKGGGGHGWVEASAGSGVGADGGRPEGERSRRRPRGGWGGRLGARAAVEREPETGRGSAASARRVA